MDINSNGLVDYTGSPISSQKAEATTPDFDPNFLKSMMQLQGDSSNVNAITQQPYANHPWIYAAVNAIVKNISRLQMVLFDKRNTQNRVTDSPVIDLFREPNQMMNGSEFFEAVYLNLLLPTTKTQGGQCFIVPLDEHGEVMSLVSGKLPTFLFPFSDEHIKPLLDGAGDFVAWEYNPKGDKKLIFFNDQVMRIRLFNPYNWLQGLSPYAALRITTVADAKSAELSEKFMDNSANIGGVLKTDAKLNKRQADDIKNMWASQYEGWSKGGKTAFLHSGLEFEQTSKTLVDLQFKDLRQMSRDTILACYGVPKSVLGLTDTVNRATAKVEKEIFWEDTLLPYIDKLWLGVNAQFMKYFGDGSMRATFDLSRIQPLKKDVTNKIKDAHQLIEDGIPAKDAYETVGLPIPDTSADWMSKPLTSRPKIDLSTGDTIGRKEAPDPTLEDTEETEEPKAIEAPEESKNALTSYIKAKKTKEDDLQFWKNYVANTLAPPEKSFKIDYIKFLVRQRNTFLDAIDVWVRDQDKSGYIKEGSLSSELFMIGKSVQDKALVSMTNPFYQEAIDMQILQLQEELGNFKTFEQTNDFNKSVKTRRISALKGVNSTTFKGVKSHIDPIVKTAIKEQWTPSKLGRELKSVENKFFDMKIKNSKLISRTEISAIASSVRFKVFKIEGITKWRWITAGDEKVRLSHGLEGDSEPVVIGQPFPVTGLIMPLDPNGQASDVANCRCVAVPVK